MDCLLYMFKCGCMKGSSSFEKVNMVMNLLSLANLALKFIYDWYLDYLIGGIKGQEQFVSMPQAALFLETLYYIDVVVMVLVAFSFIRQVITWFPTQFSLFTNLMTTYVNVELLLQALFSLYLTLCAATIA